MNGSTTNVGIKLSLQGASLVEAGLAKVEKMAGKTAASIVGIAAGSLSIAGLTAFVKGAINAADETAKIAQKTGLAAKEVAGLKLAFEQSGGAAEQFAPAMAKLGVAVVNGNKSLEAMGISGKNADGTLKSLRQVVGEVSEKFSSYEDGARKTALAVGLLGEEGAKMLPFLNQGAAGLAEYDRIARQLGLTLDTETTKKAEQFNDTLDLIGKSTRGVAAQLAAQLLPTLNTLAGEVLRVATDGQTLDKTVRVLSGAFKGLYSVGVGVVEVFKTVGKALGGVGAAIAAMISGDFGQVKGILRDMAGEIGSSWANAGASITRVWDGTQDTTVSAMAAMGGAARNAAPSLAALANSNKKTADASKAAAAALRAQAAEMKAMEAIRAKIAALEDKAYEAANAAANSVMEGNAALRAEIELIGLSDTQRSALLRTKEQEMLVDKERQLIALQNADASAGEIAALEREIALRQQRIALVDARDAKQAATDLADEQSKAYTAALEKQAGESKKFWDSVDSTAHDVFVSVANEGEDAFKRIGQTLKAAVLDMLYQMTIKKWIFQISGSFTGGGGSGTNWIDLAQQAYSAYSGGAATSAGISAGAGTVNTTSLSGIAAASAGSTGVAGGTTVAASTGTASSTMAAGGYTGYGYMGYAALIAAAVLVAENLYSKGYNRAALGVGNGESNKVGYTTYAANTEIGESRIYRDSAENANRVLFDAIGINEKWADILSGTVRMSALFGRKLKGYGLQADIDGADVNVSGYQYYKGGLFRSNKTVAQEVDSRDAAALKSEVENVRESAKAMALALGYTTEGIDNYTGSLKVNFKGVKNSAEAAERMQTSMDDLQLSMLKTASGGKLTKEAFDQFMDGIRASIQAAGISVEGIGGIITNGIVNGLSGEEIGQQLKDNILGGIYGSLAQNTFAPVVSALMGQIITPMFTAIASGIPLAQALNKAALENVVKMANEAAAFLNELFNNAEFRAAMDQFGAALSGIGGAAGRVSVPSFRAPAPRPVDTTAQDTANEREQLERELLRLQGDTVELRRRELLEIKPTNRAIKERIWALEDEQRITEQRNDLDRQRLEILGDTVALRNLEREALDASNRALFDEIQALKDAAELKDVWRDLTSSIEDEIKRIRGEVLGDSMAGLSYAQAQFATLTAQARALDQSAAAKLPDLAGQLQELYRTNSGSRSDFEFEINSMLASLSQTNRIISGATGLDEKTASQVQDKGLADKVETLQASIEGLIAVTKSAQVASSDTAKLLTKVTSGGNAMRTTAA